MSVKFKPLGDRVLVEPAQKSERTETGLYIPESAAEKPQRGTIVSVGEGRRDKDGSRLPMPVAAGDTVIFGKYAGTEVKLNGDKLFILKESDILAVIEE